MGHHSARHLPLTPPHTLGGPGLSLGLAGGLLLGLGIGLAGGLGAGLSLGEALLAGLAPGGREAEETEGPDKPMMTDGGRHSRKRTG